MPRNIVIKMQTNIKYENGEEDSLEFLAEGFLYDKNDNYYIRFKETDPQYGTTWTTIKWLPEEFTPSKVLIKRTGDIQFNQLYQLGEKHQGQYKGPLGVILIEAMTYQIRFQGSFEKGNIYIEYELYLNNQRMGMYQLNIGYE